LGEFDGKKLPIPVLSACMGHHSAAERDVVGRKDNGEKRIRGEPARVETKEREKETNSVLANTVRLLHH
jgi:hypothetical protein